jgi:hypothetical protein
MPARRKFEYDLVLSFAGEDRRTAKRLYDILTERGVTVFYDFAEQERLWGKDLYQHLQEIYRDKARFCVVFVSRSYVKKRWTRHELKQAQARAFGENSEYILPLILDDTQLPGLNYTTGYVDLRKNKMPAVAALLLAKLGKGTVEDADLDRLGWDGKFVTYNGHRMASYWPKQIKNAQKFRTISVVQKFDRIKYGNEPDDWGANSYPCGDCGVLKGQFHVSGCDIERCPICQGQAISCECNDDDSREILLGEVSSK